MDYLGSSNDIVHFKAEMILHSTQFGDRYLGLGASIIPP